MSGGLAEWAAARGIDALVPMAGESAVLAYAGVPGGITAGDGGLLRVPAGGALAARAHDGDPQGGGVAQVVGRGAVPALTILFRLGVNGARGGSADTSRPP